MRFRWRELPGDRGWAGWNNRSNIFERQLGTFAWRAWVRRPSGWSVCYRFGVVPTGNGARPLDVAKALSNHGSWATCKNSCKICERNCGSCKRRFVAIAVNVGIGAIAQCPPAILPSPGAMGATLVSVDTLPRLPRAAGNRRVFDSRRPT